MQINLQEHEIINLVEQLLHNAISQHASDVHLEPFANFLRLRLRIDGILHEINRLNIDFAASISVRLKILAKLDIAEKRLPQDGRFTFKTTQNELYDCRISICPTMFGEKIVIRILNQTTTALDVANLGLLDNQKKLLLEKITKPQGLILVTGPTGSGKTLTLYSILQLLNSLDKNISTVEDPIEINLSGINQIEVNHKIGLTFAATLRALLRQDPDIIMLGEIRDFETAEIAIKAAQTGHLVLATLHTNTAIETINRLQNMGIHPLNLATSLNMIIAQRLVRKLCENCKITTTIPKEVCTEFAIHKIFPYYTAASCHQCHRGYLGRTGVFEIFVITNKISDLILQRKNTLELEKIAKIEGMLSLRESALHKVTQGITSLAEINRVIM